jgi:hypothetical protein
MANMGTYGHPSDTVAVRALSRLKKKGRDELLELPTTEKAGTFTILYKAAISHAYCRERPSTSYETARNATLEGIPLCLEKEKLTWTNIPASVAVRTHRE